VPNGACGVAEVREKLEAVRVVIGTFLDQWKGHRIVTVDAILHVAVGGVEAG
jgi:hypothetical protein